jgi:hypothetical protein
VVFVLDTVIGLGIWIPFTIGKTVALLSVSVQCFIIRCILLYFNAVGSTTIAEGAPFPNKSDTSLHRSHPRLFVIHCQPVVISRSVNCGPRVGSRSIPDHPNYTGLSLR